MNLKIPLDKTTVLHREQAIGETYQPVRGGHLSWVLVVVWAFRWVLCWQEGTLRMKTKMDELKCAN